MSERDIGYALDGGGVVCVADIPRIGRVHLGAAGHHGGGYRPSAAARAKMAGIKAIRPTSPAQRDGDLGYTVMADGKIMCCTDIPGIGRVCLGAGEHHGGDDFRPAAAARAKLAQIKNAIAGACVDSSCGSAPEAEPDEPDHNDLTAKILELEAQVIETISAEIAIQKRLQDLAAA